MRLLQVVLDPAISLTAFHGAQAADPCVNNDDSEWQEYSNATTPALLNGTLGGRNVWQGSGIPAGNPPGAGSAGFPYGYDFTKAVIRTNAMVSIGELGYIHRPEPGRYLTLQPGGGSSPGQIPDWAMLDMFTVPNAVTAGRININSFMNPAFASVNTRRLVPLKALLNSISTSPGTVAQNIYDSVGPANRKIDTYGMRNGRDGIFDTIGEVCEVTGLDNGGATEADKEAVIRRIANLITVRSSTFTIWVLGQSIKQQPAGLGIRLTPIGQFDQRVDTITGEVKAKAIVQRYEDTTTTPPSIRFRTKYFRYLYD